MQAAHAKMEFDLASKLDVIKGQLSKTNIVVIAGESVKNDIIDFVSCHFL